MPEISRFYGIVIRMFYDDHNPPSRALGMVIEWASLHQDELRRNWALMGEEAKPKKIAPLR